MSDREKAALDRVDGKYIVDAASGCWNWTCKLDKDGYPKRMRVGSRTDGTRREVRVHRWLCIETGMTIPHDHVPDHLCRNRRCINPAHAEPVTRLVNHQRGLRARCTLCPAGHAIAGSNLVPRAGGVRCRICSNAYQRAYQRLARARSRKSELATG